MILLWSIKVSKNKCIIKNTLMVANAIKKWYYLFNKVFKVNIKGNLYII